MLRAILNISWRQHSTKLQLHGPILDIFTISYMSEECALQVTAGEQNKNSQAIYCCGHLTMVKGGLVTLQSTTPTNSVETQNAFQTTSLLCCRTEMDGLIGSWMPELAWPYDELGVTSGSNPVTFYWFKG